MPPTSLRDIVGIFPHDLGGFRHTDGQAYMAHDAQVDDVVTHVGSSVPGQFEPVEQVYHGIKLLLDALIDMCDIEVLCTSLDTTRGTSGDDGDFDTTVPEHFQTMPIQRIEAFEFFPGIGIIQTAIGHDPINVECDQSDQLGTASQHILHLDHLCMQQVKHVECANQSVLLVHRQHLADIVLFHDLHRLGSQGVR